MDLGELKGYPLGTQVALLAQSQFAMIKLVEAMDAKLDTVIEESIKRKGSTSVWNKLGSVALSILAGITITQRLVV